MENKKDVASLKCMIVDDFEMIRFALKKILNQIGITNIIEAQDGRQASDQLIKFSVMKDPVDLIFSDWNMPEMDGIELLKFCKADLRFKEIPVVMVTSEGEREAILKAIKFGASDYIVKPFNAVTVSQKIATLLAKQRVGA